MRERKWQGGGTLLHWDCAVLHSCYCGEIRNSTESAYQSLPQWQREGSGRCGEGERAVADCFQRRVEARDRLREGKEREGIHGAHHPHPHPKPP